MNSTQVPTVSVPCKTTDDVIFGPAFSSYIQSHYSEDPKNYEQEITYLTKLRQDMRGAGKDVTGRDILYRYYGQLELLDLRFPIDEKNVQIVFTWYDAFTEESISQYSIAYEKACVIFNIASTCSAIAAQQNRFDPAGLKTAFNYFQCAAGLYSYINENFLHAPSADLSRECIKSLCDLMLAQAQECFIEKVLVEKKKGAIVAKLAAHASYLYGSVAEQFQLEDVKELISKSWLDVVKVKAKYFQALSYYHNSFKLENDGSYGQAVASLISAEQQAKEATKLASSFGSFLFSFKAEESDSAVIVEMCKAMQTLIVERKVAVSKDNDLIYHDIVPNADSLPPIEKSNVVKPANFASVCQNGQSDIQRIIGPDIFQKLVPLSVHESGSVYSEEKAKILREEINRVEVADGNLQATLESLDIMAFTTRLKNFLRSKGENICLSDEVKRWCKDILSEQHNVEELQKVLEGLKQRINESMNETALMLDKEQADCESMRTRYMNAWTQQVSSKFTGHMRQEIAQSRDSLQKASSTDIEVSSKLQSSESVAKLLKQPIEQIENIFSIQVSEGVVPRNTASLIDDPNALGSLNEQVALEKLDGMIAKVKLLKKERSDILADLKEKIHNDDISALLILNKNREKQVFDNELAKFKVHQTRILNNVQSQNQILQDLTREVESLTHSSVAVQKLDKLEKQKYQILREWKRGYDLWKEAISGLRNGIQFYSDLLDIVESIKKNAIKFVNERTQERNNLIQTVGNSQAEQGQKALREQLQKLAVSPSIQSPSFVPSYNLPARPAHDLSHPPRSYEADYRQYGAIPGYPPASVYGSGYAPSTVSNASFSQSNSYAQPASIQPPSNYAQPVSNYSQQNQGGFVPRPIPTYHSSYDTSGNYSSSAGGHSMYSSQAPMNSQSAVPGLYHTISASPIQPPAVPPKPYDYQRPMQSQSGRPNRPNFLD